MFASPQAEHIPASQEFWNERTNDWKMSMNRFAVIAACAFIIVFAGALLFFLPLQVVAGILMLLPFPAMIFGIIIYEACLIFSKLKKD